MDGEKIPAKFSKMGKLLNLFSNAGKLRLSFNVQAGCFIKNLLNTESFVKSW
jgi:hypothetical protein